MDAENVDDLIANLDQLGLMPWDKTQVCILNFCFMRNIICLCWVAPNHKCLDLLMMYFPLLALVFCF